MRLLIAIALLVPVAARADNSGDKPDIAKLVAADGDPSGAAFAFVGPAVYTNAPANDIKKDLPAAHGVKNVGGGFSTNKKSYWASADLTNASNVVDGHASALWDKTDSGWKLVAFSVVPTATSKQQQDAIKNNVAPPKVPDANGASGEYFMRIFSGIFGESAAETVSDRKEAVLFGSAAKERYVGGAKIKKTFEGWKLAFTVRDGITSGLTSGKLLWIAVNLDARPLGKPKATPTPYRALLIFQGQGSDYSLVHASFAAVTGQGWAQ